MMRARSTVLGIVVVAALATGCGSDEAPQAASTTGIPSTTPVETTDVEATTTAAPATTTAPPDRTMPPATDPPVDDEPNLDTFGVLGASPVLDIRLLAADGTLCGVVGDPTAQAARIHAGVLIAARPDSMSARTDVTRLAAVEADGTIRWERCLEGFTPADVLAGPGTSATAVLTFAYGYGPEPGPTWRAFDLATGDETVPPAGLDGLYLLASHGETALVGPSRDGGPFVAGVDRYALVDLDSLEVVDLGLPLVLVGMERLTVYAELAADGHAWISTGGWTAAAVYVDGAWSEDPAVIDSTLPARIDFNYGDGRSSLTASAPSGAVRWTRPDLWDPPREGFRIGPLDSTVLVSACTREAPDGFCLESFVGIDPATGDERWRMEGSRWVPASGDGLALVTVPDGGGYVMIDVDTGELVSDTQWQSGAFAQECCGDEWTWVQQFGGVVVAHDLDHARVWYPASATTTPTAEVVFAR